MIVYDNANPRGRNLGTAKVVDRKTIILMAACKKKRNTKKEPRLPSIYWR